MECPDEIGPLNPAASSTGSKDGKWGEGSILVPIFESNHDVGYPCTSKSGVSSFMLQPLVPLA
jgi:hypothetical protein